MIRIAPSTRNFPQAILWQYLLFCRLEWSSADNATHAALQACYNLCPGLEMYLTDLIQTRATNDFNKAEDCLAFQAGYAHNKCVLDYDNRQTCDMYTANITSHKVNCLEIGIDITNALPTVTYPSTTCTMCQGSFGALGQRTYYNNPTSADCQEYCQNDASCESFDYDRTRSLCRTYEACPPSSQSKRYGCQWTLYQKPGFERPTSPGDAGNTASTRVTTSSEGPHGLENKAVASAAAPTLRRSSREQAFLLAAITALVVHRWFH